jgi:DNA-binding CsgD family transcriptional regulator
MIGMLCPEMIGRDDEVAAALGALERARAGRGGTTVLVGEAGIGKSRLEGEVAAQARELGMLVCAGRAVDGDPSAFRPLAEALQALARAHAPPGLPEAYRAALGRLVPEWRPEGWGDADLSLVLLGEAVLRLVGTLGAGRGLLLVLADLQWADEETLAVVEYLADNLAPEPVALVSSVRSGEPGPALRLVHALAARHSASVRELGRLTDGEVERMARACLRGREVPEQVAEQLRTSAEGVPLLVEELLAAWVGSGALVRDGDGWSVRRSIVPVVPRTFADMVRRRLDALDPAGRRVLQAAALLGRRFDWKLLGPTTGQGADAVTTSLRTAVGAQLLAADQHGFRFRHALTRDVGLSETLPPERAALARRALAAVEDGPGDASAQLAARLAEAAGDPGRAARLLLEAARQDRAAGALATAAATLDRARALATGDGELTAGIDEELTEVLALRGETRPAQEVGEALLEVLERAGAPARRLAREVGDEELQARATALAAHVALGRGAAPGAAGRAAPHSAPPVGDQGPRGAAEARAEPPEPVAPVALAQAALQAAARIGLPEVACEALEVIGREARQRDLAAAEAAFQQALGTADRHGLRVWRVRALHELGTIDFLREHRVGRLTAAGEAALQAGALATATVIDLQISKAYGGRFEPEACLAAAVRCEAASRRYRLDTLPQAVAQQATIHALLGREAEMEERITEALRLAPGDPEMQAFALGTCHAYLALHREELDRARRLLDEAMACFRRASGGPPRPYRGLWALMRALAGDDGEAACAEIRTSGATVNQGVAGYVGYGEAVLLGRAGRRREAEAAFARAEERMAVLRWWRHHAHRLVAPAAMADGWGDPVAWLREALDFFVAWDAERIASACRSLLRRAGVRVPRRSGGRAEVPERLRALGVTSREWEVLGLVAEGLSNAEIGTRLVVSPRTVERHVSSLLTRTGTRNRAELATLAAAPVGPTRVR